ncbi:MAG: hypothetical protein GY787_10625, partial [Alteromonadales bacterium]|nr:hypothetical protein [Alteromonadales bacterium]
LEENNLKLQIQQEANYEKREELETQLAEATAARIDAETALETRKLDALRITAELELQEIERKQTIRDKLAEMALEDIENEYERAQAELAAAEQRDLEELERLKATEEEKQRVREFYAKKKGKLEKEAVKADEIMQKKVTDNNLQLAAGAFSALSSLMGQESAAGKAAAVAAATIQTYQAAQGAYASQMALPTPDAPARAAVAAGIAVATGIANVASILKVKTPGNGGGGTGGAAPTAPSIPAFNPEAALAGAAEADTSEENIQTLGEQTGSTGGAIRAYVVSDEMTSQQEADAKINDLARL